MAAPGPKGDLDSNGPEVTVDVVLAPNGDLAVWKPLEVAVDAVLGPNGDFIDSKVPEVTVD